MAQRAQGKAASAPMLAQTRNVHASRGRMRAMPALARKGVKGTAGKTSSKDFAYGIPGSIPPVKNFDPLGLSNNTENEVKRYREAELTHGRIVRPTICFGLGIDAMLAVPGFIAGENFQLFFPDDVTNKLAINQFQQVPRPFEGLFVLFVGLAEALRARKGWEEPEASNFQLFQLRPEYEPGDIGFDPLGLAPEDDETFRTRQEQELSHGRLAMVTIFGFIVQEIKFQTGILEQFNQIQNPLLPPKT